MLAASVETREELLLKKREEVQRRAAGGRGMTAGGRGRGRAQVKQGICKGLE